MNDNENAIATVEEIEFEGAEFDLDNLETSLEADFEHQLGDLKLLEEDRKKIGNPEGLAETVGNVIWEQFVNQVGAVAGEDFIKENRGLRLDLRDEAHIQTAENFKNRLWENNNKSTTGIKGSIATHNDEIDYQARYDNFNKYHLRDSEDKIVTHDTRMGTKEATLVKGARDAFDKGRPVGSVSEHIDKDHIISAAEMRRDAELNAFVSEEDQIKLANSPDNLQDLPSSVNRAKGDKSVSDFLDYPNRKGQYAEDVHNISPEQAKAMRERDKKARAEREKLIEKGKKEAIETGRRSQKREAIRAGKAALRSALMGVLMQLLKDIIKKFISWLRSAERTLKALISKIKMAITEFAHNIRQTLLTVADTISTTIATSLFRPVCEMFSKVWMFLKQGVKSLIAAIKFLRAPENASKPFAMKVLEVSKIIIAGATGVGAIALSGAIEQELLLIPVVGVALKAEIPLMGSLASIIGTFLGAIIAGLIGALGLNLIDRLISKHLESENTAQQIGKHNEILNTQEKLIVVAEAKVVRNKEAAFGNMTERHSQGAAVMRNSMQNIADNDDIIERNRLRYDDVVDVGVSENEAALDDIFKKLNSLD